MNIIFQKFLSFFTHSPCIGCHTKNTENFYNICPSCITKIKFIKDLPHCPKCHNLSFKNNFCTNCYQIEYYWDILDTIFYYRDPCIKELFKRYKFYNSFPAEKDLTTLLTPHLSKYYDYHAIIIPYGRKTKQRLGFNPVKKIIQNLTIPYSEILIKNKQISQKKLTGHQRRQQTDILSVINNIPLELFQQKILLVDDIFTTGTTLNQGAYILRQLGFTNITALAFCRD